MVAIGCRRNDRVHRVAVAVAARRGAIIGVALWVADPNPRAQAFYRRQGFVADGTAGDCWLWMDAGLSRHCGL